ncbi:MAG: BON domain-containing protein [Planctomycetia bacterium]|nr:BON domain-containing protein [Planctomycetia bacterium]
MVRLLLLLSTVPLLAGCSDSEVLRMRSVGDRMYDRGAKLVQHAWDELGQTLLDQPVSTKQTEPDVLSKVQMRLKWDLALAEVDIQASQHEETIILTGTVKNDQQKQYALTLAEQTVGVKKVKDEVKVQKDNPPATLKND